MPEPTAAKVASIADYIETHDNYAALSRRTIAEETARVAYGLGWDDCENAVTVPDPTEELQAENDALREQALRDLDAIEALTKTIRQIADDKTTVLDPDCTVCGLFMSDPPLHADWHGKIRESFAEVAAIGSAVARQVDELREQTRLDLVVIETLTDTIGKLTHDDRPPTKEPT